MSEMLYCSHQAGGQVQRARVRAAVRFKSTDKEPSVSDNFENVTGAEQEMYGAELVDRPAPPKRAKNGTTSVKLDDLIVKGPGRAYDCNIYKQASIRSAIQAFQKKNEGSDFVSKFDKKTMKLTVWRIA